jgi:hypothetical protein
MCGCANEGMCKRPCLRFRKFSVAQFVVFKFLKQFNLSAINSFIIIACRSQSASLQKLWISAINYDP